MRRPQVTFLVAVNHTYDTCYAGGISEPVQPGLPLQDGPVVTVGACDGGPIVFNNTKAGLLVTFGSSILMDAEPPSCVIAWSNRTEQSLAIGLPPKFGDSPTFPYCTIMDSREGYHLTQFTFAAIGWD